MSFTLLYEHIIFTPKRRTPCIDPGRETDLFRYINGIITNKNCRLIRINAALNHVHLLVRRTPSISTSELVAHIKRATSIWIRENSLFTGFEGWSHEYAALSVSYYEVDKIIQYIKNQKEHHKLVSFEEEYMSMMPEDMRAEFKWEYFDR